MTQENSSPVKTISQVLVAGGVASTLIMGLINQVILILIGSSGISGSSMEPYYFPSYKVLMGALVILILGLLIGMASGISRENKKAAFRGILGSAVCLGALLMGFADFDTSGSLAETAKSAYSMIAIKAALVFVGIFFFWGAFKKVELNIHKAWKVVGNILIIILWLSALLFFIPVAGDVLFAFGYTLIGLIFMIGLYIFVIKSKNPEMKINFALIGAIAVPVLAVIAMVILGNVE